MKTDENIKQSARRLFGWIGLFCMLLIILVKALRFVDNVAANTLLVGIAPSLIGPAGLLFLILSSSGRLSRLTVRQVAGLVTVLALGLEFLQLLPRPGILVKAHYTFDWLDILASIFSVCAGYVITLLITNRHR